MHLAGGWMSRGWMMLNRAFLKAGHTPTLFCAFFYFDMAFMVWALLGPLWVQLSRTLHLDAGQKGLMVALPILSGAVLRVLFGILVDRLKPRLTGIIGQLIVIATLLGTWMIGIQSYAQVLVLGLLLGVAGASFAVALPLASRWYPPEHQGVVLGIAGAGNSGTVLAPCSRRCWPGISASRRCSRSPRSRSASPSWSM